MCEGIVPLVGRIMTSGHEAPVTAYYSYDGHVGESCNVQVSPYEQKALYKKGEMLPTIPCKHWIRWKIIEVVN